MSALDRYLSHTAKVWSKDLWDGMIRAVDARFAPLEEQLDIQKATTDKIVGRGLQIIEDELTPVLTHGEEVSGQIDATKAAADATAAQIEALYTTLTTEGVPTGSVLTSPTARFTSDAEMAAKAPLASPSLTGAPTAPTAAPGANTLQVANTAFVHSEVAALVAAAPGTLDTLGELAAALGDDANFATTMTAALAARLRFDAAQTLNSGQKAQARDNLGLLAYLLRFDAAQTLSLAEAAQARANLGVGAFTARNLLINGDMWLDQRNEGGAQTFTAGAAKAYAADRWYGYCAGANVSGQRVAGSGSERYLYQFTGAAGVTEIRFGQRIELMNSYHLNARAATLSVLLANSLLTSVVWKAYYANTDNAFGTIASPTRTLIAQGTFTVNSTLTQYQTQIAIPAAATKGIEIELSVGAQTSGTWKIGAVQLEEGALATPFERMLFGERLRRCQRHFWKTFPTGVAPAQNAGVSGAYAFGQWETGATSRQYPSIPFPVPMFSFPTMISYNPSAANAQARNSIAAADYSSTILNGSEWGWGFSATSPSGGFAGQQSFVHVTAESEL